jgi:hypothetical protein
MKPDWKDAPEWANWLAMDGDGYWYWYQGEPTWSEKDGGWMLFGVASTLAYGEVSDAPDESGIDWDFAFDTKEGRPNA